MSGCVEQQDFADLPPEVVAQLSSGLRRMIKGGPTKSVALRRASAVSIVSAYRNARYEAIAGAYRNGERLRSIGQRFGISRQRVEQIARAAGLAKRCPQKNPHPARKEPRP